MERQTIESWIVAQLAQTITKLAGIETDGDIKFLMVEEEGIGIDYLFSREKPSLVLALYKYDEFEDAVKRSMRSQDIREGVIHVGYIPMTKNI